MAKRKSKKKASTPKGNSKKTASKKTSTKKGSSSNSPTLAGLRRKIDQLDCELVEKINERARLALEVGKIKRASGQSVYAPPREDEVLSRVLAQSEGPLPEGSMRAVFRELISGSRGLEVGLGVAFLGPLYSYSHLAAIHRFGHSVRFIPVGSIAAVFHEVESRQASFGLVPVENSTDGRVVDTLDMFAKSPVRICAEVQLRIHHNLLANCLRSEIQQVMSKPQALSQCRYWLAEHLPQARIVEVTSTSAAAEAAREHPGVAAVASATAAVHFGLEILAADIQDNKDNITRFAVLGPESGTRSGSDKTSLMFQIAHQPGTLADATNIFKRAKLNLTWIESFPIPGQKGAYMFFVEFEGHYQDTKVRNTLAKLEKKTVRMEVLGSYAKTSPVD